MTDKVQKIREEVERLKGWNNNVRNSTRHMTLQEEVFNRGKHSSYLEILDFIDSLQEEPVSEDLEKAAIEAFKQIVDTNKNNFLEIFKAGAKWKEKQVIKDAIDATVFCESLKIPTIGQFLHKTNLKENDKVKVIIIKSE